jgi:phosphoribosylformylglycinamidine (FGAM) synthase PurS component
VKALVHVTLKRDVLDPQGRAIQKASLSLDERAARELLSELCKKLLANPVVEDFEIVRIERD